MKALGEATDAETKLRIQSKLAILDNNEALAKKSLAELAAAKGVTDFTTGLASVRTTLDSLKISLPNLLTRIQAGAATFDRSSDQYAVPGGMPSSASTAAAAAAPIVVPQVTVNTGAVLTSDQDLSIFIQNKLGEITKLGNGALIPAGSIAFQ